MEFNTLDFTLGSHITWKKTFDKTIKHAIKKSMNALQCFMGSPKSFKRCIITDMDLTKDVKQKAIDLGFDLAGITDSSALDTRQAEILAEWLQAGFAGQMEYLHKNFDKRI